MSKRQRGQTVWKNDKLKATLKVVKDGLLLEIDGIWVIDATTFGYGKRITLRTKHLDTFDKKHSGRFVKAENLIKGDGFYDTFKHVTFEEETS